jgi:hypothetical protein
MFEDGTKDSRNGICVPRKIRSHLQKMCRSYNIPIYTNQMYAFFVTSHCSREKAVCHNKESPYCNHRSRFHAPLQMGPSPPHFPHAFASRTHMPCQSRTHIPVTTQTKAQCIHMPHVRTRGSRVPRTPDRMAQPHDSMRRALTRSLTVISRPVSPVVRRSK